MVVPVASALAVVATEPAAMRPTASARAVVAGRGA